jgi:NAD(P)H-dependent FMN reductase
MKIAILSGSTRLHRQSHRVALALQQWLETHTLHEVDVLDLAEYRFPVLEEVFHRHPHPPAGLEEFARRVRQADAYLFVSPEYNGSYTAALKNAVDYLKDREFAHKVVGVVSVSAGALGGIRGALAMQQLVLGLGGYTIPKMLTVGQVQQRFDEQGRLLDAVFEESISQFMQDFLWLAEAVTEKRRSEVAMLH